MLPKVSLAVTVILKAFPAACDDGLDTVNETAATGLTVMLADVPVMPASVVSVAVIVCVPALFKVAENMCTPESPAVKT